MVLKVGDNIIEICTTCATRYENGKMIDLDGGCSSCFFARVKMPAEAAQIAHDDFWQSIQAKKERRIWENEKN